MDTPRQRILHNLTIPLAQRKRTHTGPYRWTPTAPMSGRGLYLECSESGDLECATFGAGFRLRIQHANSFLSNWREPESYGDSIALDTFKPIVYLLPKGRGFMAGWTMGPGMCAEMDPHIFKTGEDAARAAHSIAEYAADKESDYQEAWAEGQELRQELREARAFFSLAAQEMRAAAEALAHGARDAARLLSKKGEDNIEMALHMRTKVWDRIRDAAPHDGLLHGFAEA